MRWQYSEKAREGDHICYYSDLRRIMADYPGWSVKKGVTETLEEIVRAWSERLAVA